MACQFPDYPIPSYTILYYPRIKEDQGESRVDKDF